MSCSEIKEELENHARQERENQHGMNSCLEKIKRFLNSEPETDKIEQSLQEFSKNVRKLQEQKAEKTVTFKNLQDRFHFEVREVPFKLNGDLAEEELKLKEMQNSGEISLRELREQLNDINLDNPEAEKVRLRKAIQQGRQAQQKAVTISTLSAEIERLEKEEKSLLPQVVELPKQIKLTGSQAETLRERLGKLQLQRENDLLKASLKEHRHNLRDGEAMSIMWSEGASLCH